MLHEGPLAKVLVENPDYYCGDRCVDYRIEHTAPLVDGSCKREASEENVPVKEHNVTID